MGKEVDLIIVGGGPGGYVAAIRAAQLGGQVALVHNNDLGGTCLNRGCIPSKALIHCARQIQNGSKAKRLGIDFGEPDLDFDRIRQHAERTVKQNVSGIKNLLKANGVASIGGYGRLTGEHEVTVSKDGEVMGVVTAPNIIWASGSLPTKPPIPGIDGDGVITSDDAVRLPGPPERMVIVGGGAIGCEFAYIYSQMGTDVQVFEMLERIMPTEDSDVSEVLQSRLKRLDVSFCNACRVERIDDCEAGKCVEFTRDGRVQTIECDIVLVAAGRHANTKNMGLEEIGVGMRHGMIRVNERHETNIEGLYAIGDCIRGTGLAHQASCEGECVVELILGEREEPCSIAVPAAVYTHPEVASVGLREHEAERDKIKVKVGVFPFTHLGKAAAIREREGFIKVIIHADSHIVLGSSIIGAMAADLIELFTMAVQHEMTAEQVAEVCQAHPTLFEAAKEATLDSLGRALHLPPE